MVSVSIQFDADINIYDNRHMMMTVMTGVDQLINAFAMKVEKSKTRSQWLLSLTQMALTYYAKMEKPLKRGQL